MAIAIIAFIYGLLFGSFFNVLIFRLPREESVIFPASRCLNCGHELAWYENLPLLSYIFLRGKCKECKIKISIQYPLIELATGIYSVFLALVLGEQIQWALAGNWWNWIEVFLQYFTLLLFLPIAIIDIKHYIIPDELTITGVILALAVSFLPDGITPLQSITGALVGGGSLLLAGFFGKIILKKDEAMGGGDIKLLFWFGALFGWQAALATIFFGSFVGAVISVALISLKKVESGKHIPFGPYLCAGMLISVVFGNELLSFILP
ncbi:MAG: prepilin peptidase [Chitinivibrionia bacterium]|nr:prepilin peptidase [Chitinivibrionia bacterium]